MVNLIEDRVFVAIGSVIGVILGVGSGIWLFLATSGEDILILISAIVILGLVGWSVGLIIGAIAGSIYRAHK